MIKINNIPFLRTIATFFPLKHKLNFLVKKKLYSNHKLIVPYTNSYSIITPVNDGNRNTISDLIFEGTKSQPEFTLLTKLLNKLSNDLIMVDIGGNIGTITCQFLNKAFKIYVFEPIPRLYQVIEDSLAYNKINNVQLIKKALGNAPSKVIMLDNNNSSVVLNTHNEPTIEIEVNTLDQELNQLSKIDFIKIDVEGFEMHVLQGASSLIAKHHPTILLELHPTFIENYGYKIQDVITWLEQNNYNITYYSFLEEFRQAKLQRIINRWRKNPGIQFDNKTQFLKDVTKQPYLTSYHLLCE